MRLSAALTGLACAGLLALPHARPAAAFQIVPHRAFYKMELAGSRSSEVVDVNGDMVFEWADSCDGWAVTQRYRMTFLYTNGEQTEVDYSLVTWESKDGLRYRFFGHRRENGEDASEVRGDATLDGPGQGGVAHYTQPEDKTLALPPGTLFPTAHSLRLLDRAEAGASLVYAQVFDGSDEKGLYDVSAVIVPRAAREPGDASGEDDGIARWGVALAFYAVGSPAAEPEHEQFVDLRSDGVSEDLRFDYGSFAVHAKLVKLERLPPPSC
ncbi:MAG: cell envelope integrity EipB family protein [Rhodospirillaceae bacterium]|nr:cell envelope integrity EipB family protein [Rhodospirillaceae bacterium]